jgi:CBS domain-containing protein
VINETASLTEAANLMVSHDVGTLPVISATSPQKLVGIATQGDLLAAQKRRFDYENAAT